MDIDKLQLKALAEEKKSAADAIASQLSASSEQDATSENTSDISSIVTEVPEFGRIQESKNTGGAKRTFVGKEAS